MAQNDQILAFDPSSLQAALRQVEKYLESVATTGDKAAQKLSSSWKTVEKAFGTVTSSAAKAQERAIQGLENRAATAGKSTIDRLKEEERIALKRYGTEEQAIKRITASYAQLIKLEKERATGGGLAGMFSGQGPGSLGLRAARDIAEGRIGYGMATGGQALAGLSGASAAAGGFAVALGALAIAGTKAFTSLGDLGVEVNNVRLRTGLTTKEVGAFSFAAKAVGQDVSIFERTMRGLSQAVEDTTTAGDKARDWLTKFGVDIRGLREGTASTGDTFEKIATGLGNLKSGTERDIAALQLFKRIGIEAIPVMENLAKYKKMAAELGIGLSDDELKRFLEWKESATVIEEKFSLVYRHLKDIAATPIGWLADLIKAPANTTGSGFRFSTMGGLRPLPIDNSIPLPAGPSGQTALDITQGLRDAAARRDAAAVAGYLSGTSLEDKLKQAEQLRSKLGEINQYSTAAEVATARTDDTKIESLKQQIKLKNEGLEIDQKIAKLAQDITERTGRPYGLTRSETELAGIAKSPGVTQAQIEQTRAMLGPQAAAEFRETLTRAQNIGRDQMITHLQSQGFLSEGNKPATTLQNLEGLRITNAVELKSLEDEMRSLHRGLTYANATASRSAESGVIAAGILSDQTPAAKLATERQLAEVRIQAVSKQYEIEKSVAKDQYDLLDAQLKGAEEIGKIQEEFAKQQAQELRRQIDEIKKPAEALYTTLFTHPTKFGAQLGTTLRDAALHPIINSLSEQTARVLQPLIFGGGGAGAGGLASIRPINGAMPVVIVGGGGGGGTSVYGGGGWFGGGGTGTGGDFGDLSTLPSIDRAGQMLGMEYGGGGGITGTGGGGYGGGVTGGRGGASGIAGLAGLFGAGRGGFSLAGLKNLRGALGGFSRNASGQITGLKGGAGALAVAGGSYLAERGLIGPDAGTVGGMFEGAAGGAAIGFAAGGFLGAGIGAGAGLLIGLGEKLAGVESPVREAKRLVKAQYHIDISTSMANQIVQVAHSSYGGTISIAVRSPEVRQMLGLYAAGTGQAGMFPQSASSPHGASLVESGGGLFQQASYQYGNPYLQQSSLPVYGPSGGNYPSVGGNLGGVNMSFNIQGGDVQRFMQGQVFTPSAVSNQYSAALASSYGRTQNALDLSEPGSIVG